MYFINVIFGEREKKNIYISLNKIMKHPLVKPSHNFCVFFFTKYKKNVPII